MKPEHSIGIAKVEARLRIFLRQNALFKAFHGEGNGAPCRNRIKSEAVAKLVSKGDSRKVIVPAE